MTGSPRPSFLADVAPAVGLIVALIALLLIAGPSL
jgi:hypothetical protein